ncbi:MAG TPA: Ca2+-dependent phosphoinositide-specific phospholipase C [Thermoanaerobaculia bacterium]
MKLRLSTVMAALCLLAMSAGAQAVDNTPYNRVTQKASHNSIDRQETLPETLQFDRAQPYQAGCRAIELDLVLSEQYLGPDDNWASSVQHDGAYDWKKTTLVDDLTILRNWARANPNHDVVTVYMDLKNAPGDDATYTRKVEEQFVQALGRENLFTPGDLQRGAATLLAGARQFGWPTLAQLKNKFILVFTGADGDSAVRRRREYLSADTQNRLAFVDWDQRTAGNNPSAPPYTNGNRVFININYGRSGWCELAVSAQSATGFATRAWVENDSTSWGNAQRAAVNILATDKVKNNSWAFVGDGTAPFAVAPAGRCP